VATSSYFTPQRVASDPKKGLSLSLSRMNCSGFAAALWKFDAVMSPSRAAYHSGVRCSIPFGRASTSFSRWDLSSIGVSRMWSFRRLRIWESWGLRPWVDRRWSTDPWCIAHDSLHDMDRVHVYLSCRHIYNTLSNSSRSEISSKRTAYNVWYWISACSRAYNSIHNDVHISLDSAVSTSTFLIRLILPGGFAYSKVLWPNIVFKEWMHPFSNLAASFKWTMDALTSVNLTCGSIATNIHVSMAFSTFMCTTLKYSTMLW
jgi:hypothetical protein